MVLTTCYHHITTFISMLISDCLELVFFFKVVSNRSSFFLLCLSNASYATLNYQNGGRQMIYYVSPISGKHNISVASTSSTFTIFVSQNRHNKFEVRCVELSRLYTRAF